MLQPPPPPDQPVSLLREPSELKVKNVPPTDITFGEDDGYSVGKPASPAETKKTTPECMKCESYEASPENLPAPQLLLT